MAEKGCVKKGPHLPVGETDWACRTHEVELVRSSVDFWQSARRDDMVCPVGESERVVYVVTWGGSVQGVRRTYEEAEKVVEIRCPGATLEKLYAGRWVDSHHRVQIEVYAT